MMKLDSYGNQGSGVTGEPVQGETCYLSPEGDPLAILRVNCGMAAPNSRESLISTGHLDAYGVKVRKYGGLLQLSNPGWPISVHCLPQGLAISCLLGGPLKMNLQIYQGLNSP